MASNKEAELRDKATKCLETFEKCCSLAESNEQRRECFYWAANSFSEIAKYGRTLGLGIRYAPTWFLFERVLPFILRKTANRLP